MTIENTWKYNIDGTLLVYAIKHNGDDTKIWDDIFEPSDYLDVSYDNTNAPNFANDTDALYPGGVANLVLTGEQSFQATKLWADFGENPNRPDIEIQLWRFRKGSNPSTASPTYDSNGSIITMEPNENGTFGYSPLPKYDQDGYEYIYCAREYMSGEFADDYEQVFGRLDEEGNVIPGSDVLPDGMARETTNIYDGGAITNRVFRTTSSSVSKEWKASAFQTEFEDVAVEFTLQRRAADENEWEVVTGEDGQPVTVRMSGFQADNLTGTRTVSNLPSNNASGVPLAYQWVETGVYQGEGSTDNLLQADGSFVLRQRGFENHVLRDVDYQSTAETVGNHTTVTNRLTDTTEYDIEKQWQDQDGNPAEPLEGTEITIALYRTISGEEFDFDGQPYVSATMDGTVDTQSTPCNGEGVAFQEVEAWQGRFSGLPEYDADGRLYEYILLETAGPEGWTAAHDHWMEEDGSYATLIINAPGENNTVFVRKIWIDDSDTAHREDVTFTVYDRETHEKIGRITLEADEYLGEVGIGQRDPDEVYILETAVGGQDITNGEGYPTGAPTEHTRHEYETENHLYDATYGKFSINGLQGYSVTNRRLGHVKITAEKTWVDGDGSARALLAQAIAEKGYSLALQVEFHPAYAQGKGYDIDYASGTVCLGGSYVEVTGGTRQPIVLASGGTTAYVFAGLPMYDTTGTVAHYVVREVLVDTTTGETVSEWPEGLPPYTVTYGDVEDTGNSTHAESDLKQSVTNTLSGAKIVKWYKQWEDQYAEAKGRRPDIYLDIYRVTLQNGQLTKPEVYLEDYRVYTATDGSHAWRAELSVPKYDSEGYEYFYYAAEYIQVQHADFDYAPAEYSYQGTPYGTEYDSEGTVQGNVIHGQPSPKIRIEQAGKCCLLEEGTITNRLEAELVIEGQKLWSALPGAYPAVDLPAVAFEVTRALDANSNDLRDEGEAIEQEFSATLTVEKWADALVNGSYQFKIAYAGVNTNSLVNGAIVVGGNTDSPLPKYNEHGQRYFYYLQEAGICWPDGLPVQPDVEDVFNIPNNPTHTYVLENGYKSITGRLAVKKLLKLPENPEGYPSVTMRLTRSYTSYAEGTAGTVVEDSSFSMEQTWAAADIQEAAASGTAPYAYTFLFEDLALYAPNGAAYTYTVTEIKDNLDGYQTWAAQGDLAWDAVATDGNVKVAVTGLQPAADGGTPAVDPAATFANAPEGPEVISLTGTKRWLDEGFSDALRPDSITISLSRYANAQPGQANSIPEQPLTENTHYKIAWEKPADGDTWTYTITSEGESLGRYAPNGMPWIYRVTEEPVPGYASTPASGAVSQSAALAAEDHVLSMPDINNSILAEAYYTKQWEGFENADYNVVAAQVTVTFALQVREGENGTWQDAKQYLDAKFPGHTLNLAPKTVTEPINDTEAWSEIRLFAENLPAGVKVDNEVLSLAYRVVETRIVIDDIAYTVSVGDASSNDYVINIDEGEGYTIDGRFEMSTDGRVTRSINTLDTTTLTVSKTWANDHGDYFGTRPFPDGQYGKRWKVDVLVQQSADEGATWTPVCAFNADGSASPLVLSIEAGKSASSDTAPIIRGLPRQNAQGVALSYRAVELQAGSQKDVVDEGGTFYQNYTTSYAHGGSADTGFTSDITNTLRGTEILVEKQWENNPPETARKPVKLRLQYNNGAGMKDTKLDLKLDGKVDASPGQAAEYEAWKGRFSDLPVYMPNEDGTLPAKETDYGVREHTPPAGVQFVEVSQSTGPDDKPLFTFVNRLTASITWTKHWHDGGAADRPQSLELVLLADGTPFTGTAKLTIGETTSEHEFVEGSFTITPSFAGSHTWQFTIADLPRYNQQSQEIQYTIQEVNPPAGYESEIEGRILRNTLLTEVSVRKVWIDGENQENTRPESITIKLLANENDTGERLTLPNADGEWAGMFENLPQYDKDNQKITYTVAEEGVPDGYSIKIGVQPATNTFTVTNTLLTGLPVEKVWLDGGNAGNTRPDEVTVVLLQNDHPYGSPLTLSGSTGWKGEFTRLPKYDENGALYSYTVREVEAGGYRSSVSVSEGAATITNTLLTDVPVRKVWEGSAPAGTQPESIEVTLLANGAATDKTLTLNAGNQWQGVFEDLDAYDANGDMIRYTVSEVYIPDYQQAVTGDAEAGYVITNTYKQEMISISGEKIWNDEDDRYQKRPESIVIKLWADGELIETLTVTEADEWAWSFDQLPKYDRGTEIAYTISEEPVENYDTEVDGYDVINTLQKAYLVLEGEKLLDGMNAPGEVFTFTLTPQSPTCPMPGGTTGGTASVSISGAGSFRFGEMVFTEPGTYSYTIAETRGGTPGYFYDEAVYTVEVRVEKLENGTLSVSKHLRRNGVTVNNIVFTNRYRTTSLTVTKTVRGYGMSTTQKFTFTVILTDAQGRRLAGSYAYIGSGGAPSGVLTDGIMTVELAHGQSIRIDGLPVGVYYAVTESAHHAYVVQADTPSGVLTEAGATASFVNWRRWNSEVPKTGYGDTQTRYLIVGACLLTALLALLLRRRFRRG
ncbi:MAG TPA: Cna B-type domain-containing protein [Candidatus Avichristensenella intestinipullorum]|uniref:Cna B-type domain-containing protein n=1 Tax=Candidatus Avichristensenella intestinipullorum TaxID=2840693 RepID=A0A9D0YXF1_9FIRM|nr:Cna B-type domain-containing protein [Candidatus Avichristensenella intestinipullorum]